MTLLYVCGQPPAPAMAMEEPGKEVKKKNSPSAGPARMDAWPGPPSMSSKGARA
jgi:hypothetical protein